MRNLWPEAERHRQWFTVVASAATNFSGGFFWNEAVDHWFDNDGVLDSAQLDRDSGDDRLKLEKPLKVELFLFEKWGLLARRIATPRHGAFTPMLGLRLQDEPQGYLTAKGQRLVKFVPLRQRLTFLWMIIWNETVAPAYKKLRLVIAAIAPVFAFLKYIFHWDTEKAAIGAAVATSLAVVTALVDRKH
ncbi:MAG TPA: hypothetical protein VG960_10265 [Caulobacteraceae bacterium]|nr:hypothetical protein [Caulobacteraceae bacterium]